MNSNMRCKRCKEKIKLESCQNEPSLLEFWRFSGERKLMKYVKENFRNSMFYNDRSNEFWRNCK